MDIIRTDGHVDFMTESAQRAESVKIVISQLDIFSFQWNRRDPNNEGDMEVGKYKYKYKLKYK